MSESSNLENQLCNWIIVTDLGNPIKDIDLYELLFLLESKGYSYLITRKLRNLAYKDLYRFISTVSSWKRFNKFLRNNFDKNILPNNTIISYYSLKNRINRFKNAVLMLKRFGEIEIDQSYDNDDFTPFFNLGREHPLKLNMELKSLKKYNVPTNFTIKLYSSGLMSSIISYEYKENDISGKIIDDVIIDKIKEEIFSIKDLINKKLYNKKQDYSYFYSDRYKINLLPYKKDLDEKYTKEDGMKKILLKNNIFLLSEEKTNIIYESKENLNNILIIFEIALLQRFFLKTRDSFNDKYLRNFKRSSNQFKLDRYLNDFIEMVRTVQFIKDEGGSYKLFNNKDLLFIYQSISEIFNLNKISTNLHRKNDVSLQIFSMVSSLKRESTMLILTIITTILTIILSIDLIRWFVRTFL